jgi:hypothetical protein
MRLWEVLWTDLPCPNFHLLLCVAILDTQKLVLMENDYGFTEILKVIAQMYHISPRITFFSYLVGGRFHVSSTDFSREDCIMRSFMIITPHQILFG